MPDWQEIVRRMADEGDPAAIRFRTTVDDLKAACAAIGLPCPHCGKRPNDA